MRTIARLLLRSASPRDPVQPCSFCWQAAEGTMPDEVRADEATEQEESTPLLRQTELRKCLSEVQLKELERFCRSTVRKGGTTLFRQGEPADTLYMVLEGSIELRARPPGRRVYRTIEVVQPTCSFGDEALFGEESYLMSARVLEAARVLLLPKSSFEQLSDQHPDVAI